MGGGWIFDTGPFFARLQYMYTNLYKDMTDVVRLNGRKHKLVVASKHLYYQLRFKAYVVC